MNPYIEQLKQELLTYQAKCGADRELSILDLLWYCYSASNPVDDGRIRAAEGVLKPVFAELSFETSNGLFDHISELCTAYQRAALLEGILIGYQLSAELSQ